MSNKAKAYKLEVFDFTISVFLEQQIPYMEISMIENVKAKLISIWRISLQDFAQVIGSESFQVWNERLIAFPCLNNLNESSNAPAKQKLGRSRILINVVIEIWIIQFLKCVKVSESIINKWLFCN